MANEDGWNEWSKHVLIELKRLNKSQEEMKEDIGEIKTKMAVTQTELKLKAGIWGAIAALIPTGIGIAIMVLRSL